MSSSKLHARCSSQLIRLCEDSDLSQTPAHKYKLTQAHTSSLSSAQACSSRAEAEVIRRDAQDKRRLRKMSWKRSSRSQHCFSKATRFSTHLSRQSDLLAVTLQLLATCTHQPDHSKLQKIKQFVLNLSCAFIPFSNKILSDAGCERQRHALQKNEDYITNQR